MRRSAGLVARLCLKGLAALARELCGGTQGIGVSAMPCLVSQEERVLQALVRPKLHRACGAARAQRGDVTAGLGAAPHGSKHVGLEGTRVVHGLAGQACEESDLDLSLKNVKNLNLRTSVPCTCARGHGREAAYHRPRPGRHPPRTERRTAGRQGQALSR